MYRRAVEEGSAAPWMIVNLETIEVIERKIYNRHDFFENLALALRFTPRLAIKRQRPPRRSRETVTQYIPGVFRMIRRR